MAWFEHGTSRIYYEEYGKGEALLLLPGFSVSIEHFAALREALATHYKVIAADLPGSGRSQPQPRKYTATYYDDDSRSFTALLQHLEITSAHLVGWSDGGEVALLMATMASSMARSVVTWGSAGSIQDPEGQLRATMQNIIDNPIPPLQGFSEHLIETYGKDNARATTQSFAAGLGDIINQGGSISLDKADTITCPVLLLVGEHDMFAPPALVSQIAAKIPNGEMLTVENAGHNLHEERPEWFIQTVHDWLKQH